MATAPSIEGPWSDPIYLNSSGFDPSLFHDDDGRKWLVNMRWDHDGNRQSDKGSKPGFFAGIALQEFEFEQQRLVGPVLDASVLSDEGGRGEHANLTGAFVGMAAQDHGGTAQSADFSYFHYENTNADRKADAAGNEG